MAKRRRSQKNGSGLGLIGMVLGLGLVAVAIWFVIKFWVPLLLAVGCVMAAVAARNAPQGRRIPWGVTALGAGLLSLSSFGYIGSQIGQEASSATVHPSTASTVQNSNAPSQTKQRISAVTGQVRPRKPIKPAKPAAIQNPMVIDVHDGDTITIKYTNGTRRKVRLLGLDAPELEQRPHGLQAKTYLRRLVLNKRVRLETDRQPSDKFGRQLAYVYSGQSFINQKVLANGWALSSNIRPNVRHAKTLALAQRQARTATAGVWNPRSRLAITPEHWRKGIRPARKPVQVSVKPKPVRRVVPESPATYSAPVQRIEPQRIESPRTDVYFSNCASARAAGAAPIQVGQPGYRSGLDRDNDGVACE